MDRPCNGLCLTRINDLSQMAQIDAFFAVENQLTAFSRYLDSFTAKKRFIVEKYQQELEKYKVLFADNDKTNPFVYGIKHPNSDKLNQFLEKKEIQVARTYVDSNVLLPVNPFMSIEDVHYCTDLITKYVEYDKS